MLLHSLDSMQSVSQHVWTRDAFKSYCEVDSVHSMSESVDCGADFEEDKQIQPMGAVVAVRITSEDANDGFKPTCGTIDELSFRNSPDVWGYFSVKSGGGIHEFSDSQVIHCRTCTPDGV